METIETQKQLRRSILALLYKTRYAHPDQPGLLSMELEGLLRCPRQSLVFNLWYLKDAGYLDRTDAGRFLITAQGADAVESASTPLQLDRPSLAPTATASTPLAYKGRRM